MESCESLFPDYVASDTLARLLPPSYSFAARTTRRDEYLCSETGFRIEIQKCRCRFGCRRCAKEGTVCFTSDGAHVPCFEYSDRRIPAQGVAFTPALVEGASHLSALADKFGDSSPSLVKDIRFSERRRDAFFIVHDTSAVQSLVDQAEHVEKFSFVEIHLAPLSQEIPTARAAHIRIHDSDPENARLILATRILESEGDGLHVSSAIFFDPAKIPMQGNEAFLLAATRHLGWHTSRCVRFKGDAYVDTHDGARFSIATVDNSIQTLRIDCTTPPGLTLARHLLNTQGLSHVDTLFTQFLANRGTQTEN